MIPPQGPPPETTRAENGYIGMEWDGMRMGNGMCNVVLLVLSYISRGRSEEAAETAAREECLQ